MARQPTAETSAPPSTGPTARLIPSTLAHTPIARPRRAGSVKVLAMMASATGLSIDPPAAWSMRKPTSQPRPGDRLHSSDPMLNSSSPAWNTRRRPSRSASAPDSISRLASTRVYASAVHCRPPIEAWKLCWMDGSATLTMVTSTPAMNRLRQHVARMMPGRRAAAGKVVVDIQ